MRFSKSLKFLLPVKLNMKEDEFMDKDKEDIHISYPGSVIPSLYKSQLLPSEPLIVPSADDEESNKNSKAALKPKNKE